MLGFVVLDAQVVIVVVNRIRSSRPRPVPGEFPIMTRVDWTKSPNRLSLRESRR